MSILTERLRGRTEEYMGDEQAGFRKDRSTVQQILTLRLIGEKARRKNIKIYNCFIDFSKAFDSIDQNVTWAAMESFGVNKRLTGLLREINGNATAAIRIGSEKGSWFKTSRGTRQGDPISPSSFIILLERVLDKIRDKENGVEISGTRINNLCFADDIDLIERDVHRLEGMAQVLNEEGQRYGLNMNLDKTKTLVFGVKNPQKRLVIDGNPLETVERFTYLGSNTTYDLDNRREVWVRIGKATTTLKAMDKIWRSKAIKTDTKVKILQTCVFSGVLYGCESWVVTKEIELRILAFERKCYRKILRIGWTQKVTNTELYKRIQIKDNIMQKLIRRKLGLFGHICRMKDDRKIKTVMFGMMKGKNRRGRPHREWLDDVIGWGRASLQKLSQIAMDREQWRNLVKMAADTYGR